MSAVAQIMVVVLLLVGVLVMVGRNASAVASASTRANLSASVAADLESVAEANIELQSAFDRAAAIQDLGARVAQFSTANTTGIKGTGAFSTYVQRSLNLPHELAARNAYQRATDAWDGFAARFGAKLAGASTTPDAITQGMQSLRALQDTRQTRLSTFRDLYLAQSTHDETVVARSQQDVAHTVIWSIVVSLLLGLSLTVFAGRRASRRTKERLRLEGVRAATERRTDFEARLQRSMALAADEPTVLDSVAHTLEVVGYRTAELLVAETDEGTFTRVITAQSGEGCGVEHVSDCPAVRLRQRLDFADSDAIDACPFLRERQHHVGQCVCVPGDDRRPHPGRAARRVARGRAAVDRGSPTGSRSSRATRERRSARFVPSPARSSRPRLIRSPGSRTGAASRPRSVPGSRVARTPRCSPTSTTSRTSTTRSATRSATSASRRSPACWSGPRGPAISALATAARSSSCCSRMRSARDAELIAERVQTFLAEELRGAQLDSLHRQHRHRVNRPLVERRRGDPRRRSRDVRREGGRSEPDRARDGVIDAGRAWAAGP